MKILRPIASNNDVDLQQLVAIKIRLMKKVFSFLSIQLKYEKD